MTANIMKQLTRKQIALSLHVASQLCCSPSVIFYFYIPKIFQADYTVKSMPPPLFLSVPGVFLLWSVQSTARRPPHWLFA